jgi:nicotinamide-nucleotide amidase
MTSVPPGPAPSQEPGQEPSPQPGPAPGAHELARLIVSTLTGRGQTLAVAESLTGGLLAATLVEIPGASAVFRGGIVAYATDLKATLLGVPRPLLDRYGAVHPDVAAAMAEGVAARLSATFGVATTGVAGPDPQDGQPVGTVHIAVSGSPGVTRRACAFTGDRDSIRRQSVLAALLLLRAVLDRPTA